MTSPTITEARECACTHPDAITCLAQSERTSRFNAMLLGGCTCPCHRAVYRSVVLVQREGAKKGGGAR